MTFSRQAALLVVLAARLAFAQITPNHSASGPTAIFLERLESYGCAFPTLRAVGPLAHGEVFKAVDWDSQSIACNAPEWLLDERALMLRPNPPAEIQAYGFFGRGDAVTLTGLPVTLWPLQPMRANRTTYDGLSFGTEVALAGRTGREPWGFALGVTPGMFFGFDASGYSAIRFYLQEAQFKVGYGHSDLTFGRYARRFGTTRHGSLLYSGASAPLDTLEFTLRPIVPGGSASVIGPVTFRTWLANQGASNVKDAYLWGVELGFRPVHWWELGIAELFQFGGSGVPTLTAGEALTQVFGGGGSGLAGRRHAALALHTALWAPERQLQAYAQLLWNRLGDVVPTAFAYLLGLWFPKAGKADVRFEFVSTGIDSYRHPVWTQGLTYRGSTLGHPIGPDGRGFYVDIGLPPWRTWWHSELGFLYEGRKLNPSAGESTENRYGITFTNGRRWRKWDIQTQLALHRINGHQYRPGTNATVFGIGLIGRYTFF